MLPTSFLVDVGRGILSGAATWAMEGSEVLDFRDLSGISRFPAAGLNGVGIGDVGTGEEDGSIVRDFRSGTGFGAITGAGELLNCHLSRTDALRGVSLSFSGVA